MVSFLGHVSFWGMYAHVSPMSSFPWQKFHLGLAEQKLPQDDNQKKKVIPQKQLHFEKKNGC